MSNADNFHTHLNKCRQCEQNPFNLCPIGAMLIVRVAEPEVMETEVEQLNREREENLEYERKQEEGD